MSKSIDLDKALFYDIETHRGRNWDQIPEALQKAFINHYYDPQSYDTPEEHYSEVAGLHAEFSQVICIVFGYRNKLTGELVTTELHGKDEVEILTKASTIFSAFQKNGYYLAGHNIRACDTAYLIKRYIINRIKVPDFINEYGVKPWDQAHLDTIDLWKFGDYKRVSLETICAAMGIPCKTDELGGSNLYEYDIDDMDWEQLVHYCKEDVISNYQMTVRILEYYDTSTK
jgi:predicted PolB exonuclease-like 3'-5' exonuclease